jgi:putative membrane protein
MITYNPLNDMARLRTSLANDRTLLAYVRTMLAFVIVGLALIKLFEFNLLLMTTGIFSVVLGFGILVIGLFQYGKYKRGIN